MISYDAIKRWLVWFGAACALASAMTAVAFHLRGQREAAHLIVTVCGTPAVGIVTTGNDQLVYALPVVLDRDTAAEFRALLERAGPTVYIEANRPGTPLYDELGGCEDDEAAPSV